MSTNPNDYKSYNRERQETHTDANGNKHTNVTRTNETVSGASNAEAYREGYVQGQVSENYQEEVLAARDNENASRGLLLGILLASLAALTAGGIWLLNQRNEPVPTNVIVPAPTNEPSPAASPAPENQTTIIDRVREVPVPVPVPQQAPAQQTQEAPDINITLPSPSPAAPTPATQPESTQSQSQESTTTSAPETQDSETTNSTESPTQSNPESNTSPQ